MSSRFVIKATLAFYLVLFFGYLFGPLVIMSLTAFNTDNYPTAYPFEGFTLHWFGDLLAACIALVLLMLRLFKVSLGEAIK